MPYQPNRPSTLSKPSRHRARYAFSFFAILSVSICVARGDILFDSFTPPSNIGGFSSPNSGLTIQVSVASDLSITGMAVLNEMLSAGALRFCILDTVQHTFLLLTAPISFAQDLAGNPTWKDSTPFSFTLLGGHEYLIGYLRNVGVNDVGDLTAESRNGVTSQLSIQTACWIH